MERHRCDKCGFLAIRQQWTRQILEADDDYRASATPPRDEVGNENCENMPICFLAKADLRKEIDEQNSEFISDGILTVIQKERLCFTTRIRGLNPKEHLEMILREEFLRHQEKRGKELVIVAGVFVIIGAVIGAVISFLLWLMAYLLVLI